MSTPFEGFEAEEIVELAVLYAFDHGATCDQATVDLAKSGLTINSTELRRLIEGFERQGLVRHIGTGEDARVRYSTTEKGRQTGLRLVGRWGGVAASIVAEREQVERLRTDLLSTISHELRTPLTLIRTSVGLLLDSDPDDAMRQRLVRDIKQSTDRMHGLVNDLLDLARLQSDRLELQVRQVNLGDLVAGAVSLMRPLLDAKGQLVVVTMPSPEPAVLGDFRRLERVLLNLLSNATKFAPEGAKVDISVIEEVDRVVIAVKDRGPGIPPEARAHLFEHFYTARTSSSRHNIGAGLGLPIAKGIVEAHGGRIWIESDVGIGTTVSVSLPKAGPREKVDEAFGRG